jgi:predicted transglutaminase-like cysteine proteinase
VQNAVRQKARTLKSAAWVAATLMFAAPGAAASDDTRHPALFGSKEIQSSQLEKFSKWTGVIARYEADMNTQRQKCRVSRINTCAFERWQQFLAEVAGLPRRQQIEKVNAYVNNQMYIIDPVNYGTSDYWATPKQFFDRNGDCEDYAISKYISLRSLGVPIDEMRIVVLNDLNLKIAHAVLVVYFENQALILDNQISQVIEASRIHHYKPIYSINEHNWWLHRS